VLEGALELLPEPIRRVLESRGIRSLTPPQTEALKAGLLDGVSIVVAAPTASGKTLIGEIVLVNAALKGLKGVYVSPLKALAYEKFSELEVWRSLGLRVGISVGDYEVTEDEVRRLAGYDIVVATYERMDSIMRRRPSWFRQLGVLVIDELHMVGDESRGHIVEMIAARAKLLGVQIVGLSATIGNAEELARWLNAKLVKSSWRPVKLYEVPTYTSGRGRYVMELPEEVSNGARVVEVDDVTEYWILRGLKEGFNVLEFKYSRRAVEELAARYSAVLCRNLPASEREKLRRLDEELKESVPDFEYEKLSPLIKCGASYHHAGLTPEARRFVEEAFRERIIRYLAATPTLAMGVNLPARVVIINSKYYDGRATKRISIAEYKQLAGRAGRPQYDPYGLVVVAKDSRGKEECLRYILGHPEPVTSTLLGEESLRRHVLALIASGEASTLDELISFLSNTFAAVRVSHSVLKSKAESALERLEEMEMIEPDGEHYRATSIGEATSRLYIDPATSFIVLEGLRGRTKTSEVFYLSLVGMTPDFSDINIPRQTLNWFEELYEEYVSRGEAPPEDLAAEFEEVDPVKGFVIGLILRDWINEVPERTIVERYGIEGGDLRVIKETGEWLTYAASVVSRVSGLSRHAQALSVLAERVKHGVREDALELARLRYIGRVRARRLIEAGIRSIEDVVKKRETVVRVLGESWALKIVEEAKKHLGVEI